MELRGQILADDFSKEAGTSEHTALNGHPELKVSARWRQVGDKEIVTKVMRDEKVEGKPLTLITFSIQTSYKADADPAAPSAYGPGTGKDKEAGNGSLGFHESCHRDNLSGYARFYKNSSFPKFEGKAGMSLEEFREARNKFIKAVETFVSDLKDRALKYSQQETDEVYYKKSDFLRDHPDAADVEG